MFDPNSLYEGFTVINDTNDDWVRVKYKGHKIFRFKRQNLDLFTMDSNRCFSYDLPDAEGVFKKRVVYYINDLGYVKKVEEEKDRFGIWSISVDRRVKFKEENEYYEEQQ